MTIAVTRLPLEFHIYERAIPQGMRFLRSSWKFPDLSPWRNTIHPSKKLRLSLDDVIIIDEIILRTGLSKQDVILSAILVSNRAPINRMPELTSRLPVRPLFYISPTGEPEPVTNDHHSASYSVAR